MIITKTKEGWNKEGKLAQVKEHEVYVELTDANGAKFQHKQMVIEEDMLDKMIAEAETALQGLKDIKKEILK